MSKELAEQLGLSQHQARALLDETIAKSDIGVGNASTASTLYSTAPASLRRIPEEVHQEPQQHAQPDNEDAQPKDEADFQQKLVRTLLLLLLL